MILLFSHLSTLDVNSTKQKNDAIIFVHGIQYVRQTYLMNHFLTCDRQHGCFKTKLLLQVIPIKIKHKFSTLQMTEELLKKRLMLIHRTTAACRRISYQNWQKLEFRYSYMTSYIVIVFLFETMLVVNITLSITGAISSFDVLGNNLITKLGL